MTTPPLGIAAVLLRSPAPERLAAFYREHLAVPLARVDVAGLPVHWACDVGAVYLSIWPSEGEQAAPARGQRGGVALHVRDVAAAFARLRTAVEVEHGPKKTAIGTIARLRDPEGNIVELYQAP